jgi:hypothetical protein
MTLSHPTTEVDLVLDEAHQRPQRTATMMFRGPQAMQHSRERPGLADSWNGDRRLDASKRMVLKHPGFGERLAIGLQEAA